MMTAQELLNLLPADMIETPETLTKRITSKINEAKDFILANAETINEIIDELPPDYFEEEWDEECSVWERENWQSKIEQYAKDACSYYNKALAAYNNEDYESASMCGAMARNNFNLIRRAVSDLYDADRFFRDLDEELHTVYFSHDHASLRNYFND